MVGSALEDQLQKQIRRQRKQSVSLSVDFRQKAMWSLPFWDHLATLEGMDAPLI